MLIFFLEVLGESLVFVSVKDIRKLLWLCSHPSFLCPWVQWPRSLQHLPRERRRCCRLWPWDGQGEICLLAASAIAVPAIRVAPSQNYYFTCHQSGCKGKTVHGLSEGFCTAASPESPELSHGRQRRLSCLGVHRLALLFVMQKPNECLRLYVVIRAGLKFPTHVVSLKQKKWYPEVQLSERVSDNRGIQGCCGTDLWVFITCPISLPLSFGQLIFWDCSDLGYRLCAPLPVTPPLTVTCFLKEYLGTQTQLEFQWEWLVWKQQLWIFYICLSIGCMLPWEWKAMLPWGGVLAGSLLLYLNSMLCKKQGEIPTSYKSVGICVNTSFLLHFYFISTVLSSGQYDGNAFAVPCLRSVFLLFHLRALMLWGCFSFPQIRIARCRLNYLLFFL